MINFKDKKVAFLGYGVDNQDIEPWLTEQGAQITILDEKINPDAFKNLNNFEVLIRTPGVYRKRKEILEAEEKGVIVTSKTKIFFDVCPTKNIIGVTGTKGKGTSSSLIYEILKLAGKDVYIGGNIGKGIFEFLSKLNSDSWVVLELSSFQLMDLHTSPHIAVVLMTTSDHLDWHKDIEEYVEAKANITKYQTENDFVIFNEQYEGSVKIGNLGNGKKIKVQRNDWSKPLRLRGEHNKENMIAAAEVAKILNIDEKIVSEVANEFKGLEHRLEEVGTVNGVTYYDDSISTTPETAVAAIQSFTEPIILILGGSDKGSDYTNLAEVISKTHNIKAIFLIGVMADKIQTSLDKFDTNIPVLNGGKNMHEIFQNISKVSEPGDVVLLSPACASFGMFKDYKERGDLFKKEVFYTTKSPCK